MPNWWAKLLRDSMTVSQQPETTKDYASKVNIPQDSLLLPQTSFGCVQVQPASDFVIYPSSPFFFFFEGHPFSSAHFCIFLSPQFPPDLQKLTARAIPSHWIPPCPAVQNSHITALVFTFHVNVSSFYFLICNTGHETTDCLQEKQL